MAHDQDRFSEWKYKSAMCIYKLQREAGMSFREARVMMIDRGESSLGLYKEYRSSSEAFRVIRSRANRKLAKTGKNLEELCGEDYPDLILMD